MLALSAFLGIGLLAHLAEKRWPLRTYQTPKAWAVNAFAVIFGAVISLAYRKIFPHTVGRLPDVPGFEWIGATAQFVETTVPWPVAFVVSVVVLDFLLYLTHRLCIRSTFGIPMQCTTPSSTCSGLRDYAPRRFTLSYRRYAAASSE
jgi:hypothetical protein